MFGVRLLVVVALLAVPNFAMKYHKKIPPHPELFLTTIEIIIHRGYPAEVHHVVTDDGYILELHRIPAQNANRKPVLIQHGLFGSSNNWVTTPSNSSLAFQLADLGYDVWLGNSRGNIYSNSHIILNAEEDYEYWNFSYDEMGNFDIPAVIDYILKQTGEPKLIYVGHSLGSAMFFIAMINHPQLNDKVEMMFALAPCVSVQYFRNTYGYLAPYESAIKNFLRLIRVRSFQSQTPLYRRMKHQVCGTRYYKAFLCRLRIGLLVGYHPKNMDLQTYTLIEASLFNGASVNTILQMMQNHNSGGSFLAFDHGPEQNIRRYGTGTPQVYDLRQVQVPVHMFYSKNDLLVDPKDAEWLKLQLGIHVKTSIEVVDPKFTHIDYLFGKNVNEMVYNQIFSLLPPAVESSTSG